MKKPTLIHGRGGNSTTKAITFAHAQKMPKYMRILEALVNFPGLRRWDILAITHGGISESHHNPRHNGEFATLTAYGLATFRREGRQCFWRATPKGKAFLLQAKMEGDLA